MKVIMPIILRSPIMAIPLADIRTVYTSKRQYFSPTLDQACFPGTKRHLYWLAGHLFMSHQNWRKTTFLHLYSTSRFLRFKQLTVFRAPFLAEYTEMELTCRCVLIANKKYLSDQFLLTPDDDLNYFLAKSTTICRREFTKIGVGKSGEPARPAKLFIILEFLDEHSYSLTLLLNQIAAPPSHHSISLATCCSKCLYSNTNVDVSLPQLTVCVCAITCSRSL